MRLLSGRHIKDLFYRSWLLILWICLLPPNLAAQQSYLLKKIAYAPTAPIEDIVIDSMGFTWIGTSSGLFKFDGELFREYVYDPFNKHSLAQNFITDLYIDEFNELWVSTFGAGLARYRPLTDDFKRYELNALKNNTARASRSFFRQGEDSIWISSYYGLSLLDLSSDSLQHFIHPSDDKFNIQLKVIPFGDDLIIENQDHGVVAFNTRILKYRNLDNINNIPLHNTGKFLPIKKQSVRMVGL